MMLHHMLSVARRATPPSGASLMPAATSHNTEAAGPTPPPADRPVNMYRPASALATVPVTVPSAGSQVSLPTALAAYQEFTE